MRITSTSHRALFVLLFVVFVSASASAQPCLVTAPDDLCVSIEEFTSGVGVSSAPRFTDTSTSPLLVTSQAVGEYEVDLDIQYLDLSTEVELIIQGTVTKLSSADTTLLISVAGVRSTTTLSNLGEVEVSGDSNAAATLQLTGFAEVPLATTLGATLFRPFPRGCSPLITGVTSFACQELNQAVSTGAVGARGSLLIKLDSSSDEITNLDARIRISRTTVVLDLGALGLTNITFLTSVNSPGPSPTPTLPGAGTGGGATGTGQGVSIEFSDLDDLEAVAPGGGLLPNSGQILATEAVDAAGAPFPANADDFGDEVDALAHQQDTFFGELIASASSPGLSTTLFVSFVDDPLDGGDNVAVWAETSSGSCAPEHRHRDLYFEDSTASVSIADVDGIEFWDIGQPHAADAYSLADDSIQAASVFTTRGPYITHSEIVSAVQDLGFDGEDADVDVDALMMFDVLANGVWETGDAILFSIRSAGNWDGGEIVLLRNTPSGTTQAFFNHAGHDWDTAFDPSLCFGIAISDDEVDGLEAGFGGDFSEEESPELLLSPFGNAAFGLNIRLRGPIRVLSHFDGFESGPLEGYFEEFSVERDDEGNTILQWREFRDTRNELDTIDPGDPIQVGFSTLGPHRILESSWTDVSGFEEELVEFVAPHFDSEANALEWMNRTAATLTIESVGVLVADSDVPLGQLNSENADLDFVELGSTSLDVAPGEATTVELDDAPEPGTTLIVRTEISSDSSDTTVVDFYQTTVPPIAPRFGLRVEGPQVAFGDSEGSVTFDSQITLDTSTHRYGTTFGASGFSFVVEADGCEIDDVVIDGTVVEEFLDVLNGVLLVDIERETATIEITFDAISPIAIPILESPLQNGPQPIAIVTATGTVTDDNTRWSITLGEDPTVSWEGQSISVFGTPGNETFVPRFRRGDANRDGVVFPLIDALYILDWSFTGGPPPLCMDAADTDDDGTVAGILDALFLLDFSFLGGEAPSSPFGECGIDPTPDDVDCFGSFPLDPDQGCE